MRERLSADECNSVAGKIKADHIRRLLMYGWILVAKLHGYRCDGSYSNELRCAKRRADSSRCEMSVGPRNVDFNSTSCLQTLDFASLPFGGQCWQ